MGTLCNLKRAALRARAAVRSVPGMAPRSLQAFAQLRRADALAAGAVTPAALAAARGVSVRVVQVAIRKGWLPAFVPVDSARSLVPPDAAATWRAHTLATIEETFSVREVAERVRISRASIHRAIRTGKLQAGKPGLGDYRITAAAVRAWLYGGASVDATGAARRVAAAERRTGALVPALDWKPPPQAKE